MIPYTFARSNTMPPKYGKEQTVIIKPIKNKHLSSKDYRLEPYKGMIAEVADYYCERVNAYAAYLRLLQNYQKVYPNPTIICPK